MESTKKEVTVRKGEDKVYTVKNPMIINGKSYFPLRNTAQALGYRVIWDGVESIIRVAK